MRTRFLGWSFDQFIEAIGRDFPLLLSFAKTEQDPGWHGEGNVAVHTNLVLQQAYLLIETCASHLTVAEQDVLVLSALLHDYGKPLTTKRKEKDGVERVVAPHHELIGASLLFSCPPPFHLTAEQWKQVVQLVAYHDQPKRLVYMSKGEAAYKALSRKIPSMELIYLLEVADRRGTASDDFDAQLEMLEVFKLFSEELGVWKEPAYQALADKIDQHFKDKDESFRLAAYHKGMDALDKELIQFEDEVFPISYQNSGKSHVIVMCALSASGKSSFIKKNLGKYRVISPDEIRERVLKDRLDVDNHAMIYRIAYEELREALRVGQHVVWDATNIRFDYRDKVFRIANSYGAFVELILIQSSLKRCLKNNDEREHAIPADIIRMQAADFQLPDLSEVHKMQWIC